MKKLKKFCTRDIVFLSLLSTLAFISVCFIKIPLLPSAPFLRFDIRDAIILIGGLIYGPFAAFIVAFIAGLLQFFLTNGGSGIIGFFMNLISTASFVCPASFIYGRGKNYRIIFICLAFGCSIMSVNMLLWNYIVTPFFMGVPRDVIVSMLIPVFLPFNLLKGCINSVIVLLCFKPLMSTAQSLG